MGRRRAKTSTRLGKPRSIYEPLPLGEYLRILVLHPGSDDDEIKCELKVQTYKRSTNTYAAISYVWGDPANTVDIKCNGLPTSITVSLAEALRQFRHPRTIRRLWADALCINQKDDQEKGHQVGKMGKIYHNATKVLVWLGEDFECIADDCFRLIERTNQYFDKEFLRSDMRYEYMPRLKAPFPIAVDRDAWSNVATLIELPWFARVWTVQECALAKECRLCWGSSYIDVAEVFEVALWCRRCVDLDMILEGYGYGGFTNLLANFQTFHCHYREELAWQRSKPGLVYEANEWSESCFSGVLHSGRYLNAAEPRDHVYAFLGCSYANDAKGQPILEADYSISIEQAWYQVARTLVQIPTEGPWFLSAVQHGLREVVSKSDSPSWVPCWNTTRIYPMIADPARIFEAGGPIEQFVATPRRGKTLELRGFVFDTVAWRSAQLRQDDFDLRLSRDPKRELAHEPTIDSLWRQASLAAENLGFILDEDVFTMTLLTSQEYKSTKLDTHRARFKTYCEAVRSEYRGITALNTQSTDSEEAISIALDVMDFLRIGAGRRHLFLTHGGRVGLAPGDLTEVGDVCCIFSGATVPFILTPPANYWHKLVSECYIFGVMHGQLMDRFEAESILLE
jgi:hypothetical protein